KDFTQMMNSKTMVVLVGDTAFDNSVKRAMKKYWTITKYDFIEMKDIDAHIADEGKSFLLPFVITVTYTHSAGSKFSDYSKLKSWYSVLLGGRKSLSRYTDKDPIAIAPFNYYGDEKVYLSCAYRLDYMVKGINDAFTECKDKQLSGSYAKIIFKCIDNINLQTVEALSKKTLVVNKDMMCWYNNKNMVSKELFDDAKYAYKIQYVSDAEFKSIMKGNSSEYLCFFPSIEVNKHMIVFDPSTRKTVYYGWAMQGLKVTKKDIKSMSQGKS
ncbi:MAG TPA: hypothetical protein VGF30_03425, partial [Bacteroidia bacterium]